MQFFLSPFDAKQLTIHKSLIQRCCTFCCSVFVCIWGGVNHSASDSPCVSSHLDVCSKMKTSADSQFSEHFDCALDWNTHLLVCVHAWVLFCVGRGLTRCGVRGEGARQVTAKKRSQILLPPPFKRENQCQRQSHGVMGKT